MCYGWNYWQHVIADVLQHWTYNNSWFIVVGPRWSLKYASLLFYSSKDNHRENSTKYAPQRLLCLIHRLSIFLTALPYLLQECISHLLKLNPSLSKNYVTVMRFNVWEYASIKCSKSAKFQKNHLHVQIFLLTQPTHSENDP